ncbi:hypothetical protein ANCDUO_07297, partial [Ancylostoma duodenale]
PPAKPILHLNKVMLTIWQPAAGLIHYSYQNPDESVTTRKCIQEVDEMYLKLQHTYVWSIEKDQKFPTKKFRLCLTNDVGEIDRAGL